MKSNTNINELEVGKLYCPGQIEKENKDIPKYQIYICVEKNKYSAYLYNRKYGTCHKLSIQSEFYMREIIE